MQWLWNIESNQPNPSQSGLRQAASAGQAFAATHRYTFTLGLNATRQTHLAALEALSVRVAAQQGGAQWPTPCGCNRRGYSKMPWEGASYGESVRQGLTIGVGVNPKAMSGSLWGQANLPDQVYAALRESVYQALLPQTRLKPCLDNIGLTLDATGIQLDFSAVHAAFTDTATTNPDKAIAGQSEFNRYCKDLFANMKWQTEGWQLLGDTLNAITLTNLILSTSIQKTLAEFNIGMDGQVGFNTNDSNRDDLCGEDDNDTLSGNDGNDIHNNTNGAKSAVLFERAKRIKCEVANDAEGRIAA